MQPRNIKRKILVPLSLLMLTSMLFAQPGQDRKGPPPMPNKAQIADIIEDLDATLNLSKAQRVKISSLYNTHFEEVEELMERGDVSRQTMQTMRKHFESQVEAVLSKSQIKAYQKFQEDRRPQQRGGRR